MDDTADIRARITLLEQRVSALQADLDVGLSQLRERVELQVEALDRRLTRLERAR